ncbi:MAG TPA: biotin/lipoyl-containing protein [Chloroflexota bacterium]|nr:biotin/lipoyl-containing protein [Chloroflexota bacterium]
MSSDAERLDRYVADELPHLVRIFSRSRARELEIVSGDLRVAMKRAEQRLERSSIGTEQQNVAAAVTADDGHSGLSVIPAPMVGMFFHSERPGQAALIAPGSRVEPGSLIGVIEALQVLTEVEADARGVVENVLVADGQPVEYGQPLVEVRLDV